MIRKPSSKLLRFGNLLLQFSQKLDFMDWVKSLVKGVWNSEHWLIRAGCICFLKNHMPIEIHVLVHLDMQQSNNPQVIGRLAASMYFFSSFTSFFYIRSDTHWWQQLRVWTSLKTVSLRGSFVELIFALLRLRSSRYNVSGIMQLCQAVIRKWVFSSLHVFIFQSS